MYNMLYKFEDFLVINEVTGKRVVRVTINNKTYELGEVLTDEIESNVRAISKKLDQAITTIKINLKNKNDKFYITQAIILLLIKNKKKVNFEDLKIDLWELKKRLSPYLNEAVATLTKKKKTSNFKILNTIHKVNIDGIKKFKSIEKTINDFAEVFNKYYKDETKALIRTYIELSLLL